MRHRRPIFEDYLVVNHLIAAVSHASEKHILNLFLSLAIPRVFAHSALPPPARAAGAVQTRDRVPGSW